MSARVLVFALALTQLVGLAELVFDEACEQACEDEGCGTDCLPGLACRCHGPSAMPVAGEAVAATAKQTWADVHAPGDAEQRMHASPDPREILHVPRLAA